MDVPNIPDIWSRCKASLGRLIGEYSLLCLVFLVALASFGLGKLSLGEAAKPVVSVSEAPLQAEPEGMAVGGLVVASRNGSVYHFPWCGGASQINEANKIWFASEDAAATAGYTPSKSCKGLGKE